MDDTALSSRRELFSRDGMLRASADHAAVADLYRLAECVHDLANTRPLPGWMGAPREPFSAAVRRAELDLAQLRLVGAIMYHSGAARSIRDCTGGSFVVASARVFATPAHGADDPGLSPLFVPAPPGIVRTITFLHDLDHTSSPFELRVNTSALVPSTPRGTMVIFNAGRVAWKERAPLRGARVILETVCVRRPDLPPQVWSSGMNYWPLDPACPVPAVPLWLVP